MTEVKVKGNLEGALKNFKQKCARDGILSETKKRKFQLKEKKRKRILSILENVIKEITEELEMINFYFFI